MSLSTYTCTERNIQDKVSSFMPSLTQPYRFLWFSTGIMKANMLILEIFITCPIPIGVDDFLKMAYMYVCAYIYTYIHIHIQRERIYYSITQYERTYSHFKQNFTSIVESHVLILKPTITFSWFFFSKWFFHNSMK